MRLTVKSSRPDIDPFSSTGSASGSLMNFTELCSGTSLPMMLYGGRHAGIAAINKIHRLAHERGFGGLLRTQHMSIARAGGTQEVTQARVGHLIEG